MEKSDELRDAFETGQLVRLNRKPLDEHDLNGYIVGLSDRLLLLQVVDGSTLLLNGYAAVRIKDLKNIRVDATFVSRYLQLREIRPTVPTQIDLADWPALLTSVARQYSLFMIECEKVEPGVGFIGHIEKLTKSVVRLKKLEAEANWVEAEDFKLSDITQVGFADGYTQALRWLVAHDEGGQQAE